MSVSLPVLPWVHRSNYKGETGLAFGLGYTATNVFRFNVGVSTVPNQGNAGVFGGAAWTLN